VKYFLDLPESDLASTELQYIQAVYDVVNSVYMCKVDHAYTLAALQLQEKYGDAGSGCASLIRNSLSKYLPERNLTEDPVETNIEEVLRRYAQLQGVTQIEAQLSYLDFVKLFPSYGSSYFYAVPINCREYPKEVAIAVSPKGVAIVDNYSKEYIDNYLYESILTWGHTYNQFVLVIGPSYDQQKMTFKCADGKEISYTMHAYVDARPNRKKGARKG
jgi:hypothetical protein